MPGSCGKADLGTLVLPLFGAAEEGWPPPVRAALYLLGLLWFFLGVGIIADIFMTAIEVITSKELAVKLPDGSITKVRVWNATVANLTLMALGSSAPEILLAVIEIVGNDFVSGDLGPSTIVGSAAFNLFVIIAVCVTALPAGETRVIADLGVYAVTASCSIFAYVWLLIILVVTSPNRVTMVEGALTFLFFPVLVALAFAVDKGYICGGGRGVKAATADTAAKLESQTGLGMAGDAGSAPTSTALALASGGEVSLGATEEEGSVTNLYRNPLRDEQASAASAGARRLTPGENVIGVGDTEYRAFDVLAVLKAQGIKSTTTTLGEATQIIKAAELKKRRISRAAYRVNATRELTGGKRPLPRASLLAESSGNSIATKPLVQFAAVSYSVSEGAGVVELAVVRGGGEGALDAESTVHFRTVDGTAKGAASADVKGADFVHQRGALRFAPGEARKTIEIVIVDDDEPEDDETFSVELHDAGGARTCAGTDVATVTIIDDDRPGCFAFHPDDVELAVLESEGAALLRVRRENGAKGEAFVDVRSADVMGRGAATAGKDYLPVAETLTFLDGEIEKVVRVRIIDDNAVEADEVFEVKLERAHGAAGVVLGERRLAMVTIRSDDTLQTLAQSVAAALGTDVHRLALGTESWGEQFRAAVTVEGGEEDAPPSKADYFAHALTLPFKLLFAIVPPTTFAEGKLTFAVALMFIGGVTAVIGDLATLFGCVIGLEASITAITFVALGTSLPDTFASKAATIGDETADAAIGNVTGSNSVNVFLGLGMPWFIASVYWAFVGRNDAWDEKYDVAWCDDDANAEADSCGADGLAFRDKYSKGTAELEEFAGAFIVDAGSLSLSVGVFTCNALICLGVLLLRRKYLGAELGGDPKWAKATAALLVMLWLVYVLVSVAIVEGWF